MTIDAPLELHSEQVRDEWIDYNGHMNVAYYVLAFDHATDAFLNFLGLDAAHRDSTGGSTFTVEAHVTYQNELRRGDSLRVSTHLLGYDVKRIHYYQQMRHGADGYVAATCEWLVLYVDLNTRRTAAMPAALKDRLAEVLAAHRALPRPAEVGRTIRTPIPPEA